MKCTSVCLPLAVLPLLTSEKGGLLPMGPKLSHTRTEEVGVIRKVGQG